MPVTTSPTQYRPAWIPLLVALALIALFSRLGVWQLSRADEKRAILASAAEAPVVAWQAADNAPPRYAHLQLSGYFDPQRHVLLDNQVLNGRPGVHVWTPFHSDNGSWVLINRGWLPLPPERNLPAIDTPSQHLELQAQVNQPPRVGKRLGGSDTLRSDDWPQLVTYLDVPLIAAALNQPLQPWILQLSASSPGGFAGRHWPVVNFGPQKHLSYAWTWFTLATTVLLVTVLLHWRGWRRRRGAVGLTAAAAKSAAADPTSSPPAASGPETPLPDTTDPASTRRTPQ